MTTTTHESAEMSITALHLVSYDRDNKESVSELGKDSPIVITALESVNLVLIPNNHSFLKEYPAIPAIKFPNSRSSGT